MVSCFYVALDEKCFKTFFDWSVNKILLSD